MDEEIQTIKRDKLKAYHSMVTISEALPALGIVAAVLGVIKAMGALDQAPEVLGHLIGAALVGTFAGIFFSYAVVSPIATKIKIVREKKMRLYVIVKQTLLAFMNGAMPQVALEHGRKTISAYERPTIDEVEQETLSPGGARRCAKRHARRRRERRCRRQPDSQIRRDSLQELFAGSSSVVERLPMLRAVFERAAATCTRGIARARGTQPPQLALQGIESGIAADMLAPRRQGDRRRRRCTRARLECPSCWSAPTAAPCSPSSRRMLGGDGSQPAYAGSAPLSRIEARVAAAFFERVRQGARRGLRARRRHHLRRRRRSADADRLRRSSATQHAVVAASSAWTPGAAAARCWSPCRRRRSSALRQALVAGPRQGDAPAPDAALERSRSQSEVTRAHVDAHGRARRAPGSAGRGRSTSRSARSWS